MYQIDNARFKRFYQKYQEEIPFRKSFNRISVLTHITRIRCDFDVANSPRYLDDNTLPHIVRFRSKIQETLCKSREAVTVFFTKAKRRLLFLLPYATVVLILPNNITSNR